MLLELSSFSASIFSDIDDAQSVESDQPWSIESALDRMREHDSATWKALADDWYTMAQAGDDDNDIDRSTCTVGTPLDPEHLAVSTVIERIQATNLCQSSTDYTDVWIDADGYHTVTVWNKPDTECLHCEKLYFSNEEGHSSVDYCGACTFTTTVQVIDALQSDISEIVSSHKLPDTRGLSFDSVANMMAKLVFQRCISILDRLEYSSE